jgi:hypothetical protein
VIDALTALQTQARRPRPETLDEAAGMYTIPGVPGPTYLGWNQRHAVEHAKVVLENDERFEGVDNLNDLLYTFVGQCVTNQTTDHVPGFIALYSKEPFSLTCYIPVEHLELAQGRRHEAFGVVLVAPDDPQVPGANNWFSLDKPVGSVAVVEVTGTDSKKMAVRARTRASRAMRLLRIALRNHRSVHDRQLRFTLAESYAFNDTASGWASSPDVAYDVAYSGELVDIASKSPLAVLTEEPDSDILKKADLATQWMERAWLTGDRLVALLYLFFALESLLGDKSEGLKAQGIAFRQMLLSHIADGQFRHPNECFLLYEKVRSAAVHGEEAPQIEDTVLSHFASDVRRTLERYLKLASEEGFKKRSRLLGYLDRHEDRSLVEAWLRENAGTADWERFFAGAPRSITFGPESDELGVALEALSSLHLVVEVQLVSGNRVTGVLSEVADTTIFLHGFDEAAAVETHDLIPVPLNDIRRIGIA